MSKEIPRMTTEAMEKFITGYCNKQIYTDQDCPENLLHLVFMVLTFSDLSDTNLDNLGLIWEWTNEAGPRGINGHPTFFSCSLMHKKDFEICKKAIKQELKRREDLNFNLQEELDLEEKKDVDK